MKEIELNTTYQVGQQDVFLTVVIGDAQIGASVVFLDGKNKGEGDIDKLLIGPGPKIRGKLLSIKSVVTDVNDSTNRVSVTYRLRGGTRNQDFVSKGMVDKNGDSVIFRAEFDLI